MGGNKSATSALLLLLLLSGILHPETIQLGSGCQEAERKALLQFKQSLRDPSGQLSSWVGEDCCSWSGVSCNNRTASVIKLNLNNPFRDSFGSFEDDAGHELGGEISPSLLQLKDLEYLDLSMSNFTGFQVPEFIGSLKELRYLNLSGSFFSGTIPQSLGNLSNLLYLDLNNFLDQSNQIDLEWLSGLSSLVYFNLGGADLSKAGAYWLEVFNKLHSFVELHLPNCNLPSLPLSFPSLNFASLQVLDLSNNDFNSTTPHWLFNITSLLCLDLGSNDLQGDIPDGFASLNSLQELDLSGNSFLGGQLSRNLGKLCNLRTMILSRNNISSEVSDFLDGLSECTNSILLEKLELRFNQFTENFGQLSALEVLDLSENKWEGVITESRFRNLSSLEELSLTIESPQSLTKDSINVTLLFNISSDWFPPFKLGFIKLRSCQLGPKFPTWLRNQTELRTLVLNKARISDTIPDWFWQLSLTLDELDVAYNELRGRVPNSLGFNFPATVDLSSNNFEGRLPLCLSGSIPESIGSLRTLRFLVLRNNYLSGELPLSLKNCTFMESLDLGDNNLSGNIPAWIGASMPGLSILRFIPPRVGNLSDMKVEPPKSVQHEGRLRVVTKGSERKYFTTLYLVNLLDLSSTNLSAEIPAELTSLVHLGTLNLSHNHLVGKIPEEIGNFEWLETLDLSKNKLSGSIPPSMASLIFMNHLNLSYNNLSGEIPNTNQFQTLNDPSIYEGNLALCGDPLPKKCPENGGRSPVPRGDDEDEDEHDKLWLFVSVALGFIAGFWGFFGSSC
ncbi:hypothetical protein KPL70_003342 [Citrus sinensis]|nr:hypothetical protein KPL70_003342 [Citrus sinensis]